jgi:hypothetical protein
MIGLPSETVHDLKATLYLNKMIQPHRMKFSIFYPYPSTPLRYYCEKQNLINWKKMEVLDNYQTDTPLKFNRTYLKFFKHILKDLSLTMNRIYDRNDYMNIPNVKGMIIKREDLIR